MDDSFIDFLIAAKKASYTGRGPQSEPSKPQSHDYRFAAGEFAYADVYLGEDHFIGQEAVWKAGQPLWGMNYVGRVVNEGFSSEFLHEVLLLVPRDNPYRGPVSHSDGGYSYSCIVKGSLDWFYGYERIWLGEVLVYEGAFHGGEVG
ncbi:MAG: DUF5680 domain-containing protein [Propionibacteriaceae bacterium]|jgi:hypothetical protein|nr:DUF5680 domain-containing protein [Propionibacteriaceae bacterium]